MAPVLAIAGMVAGPSQPRRFDPVGEIFQPFVTGPNRIPFFMQESRDDGEEEAVAEPKREEGVGATPAIGGPRPDRDSSAGSRDRCGQQFPLRGSTSRPGRATGAALRVFYRGLVSSGGLVTKLWREDRSHAVYRRLLDSAVRHSGSARLRGLFGECPAHQESARTQERRAGEPVVAEVAHLWIAEQLVPTAGGDSGVTHVLAATSGARTWCSDLHATDAESTDPDESATGQCDQRHQRADRTGDPTRDHCGRTRCRETG